MAVTITDVQRGPRVVIVDVIATADGDLFANVQHGFGRPPAEVYLTPLHPAYYVSTWYVQTIGAAVVVLTKANAVGSGQAGAQVRAFLRMNELLL